MTQSMAGTSTPSVRQHALVAAHVARLALAAKPSVSVRGDMVRVDWREDLGMTASLAWIMPDQLISALVDALPVASGLSLSAGERQARVAHLEMQLLEHERREVALIERGRENGIEILYRPDVDVRACLNVAFAASSLVARRGSNCPRRDAPPSHRNWV